MATTYETDDKSLVEFQLGNKQLFLLFVGLLVVCAIFFFIGLRVGEDTAHSRAAIMIGDEAGPAAGGRDDSEATAQLSEAENLALRPQTEPARRDRRTEARSTEPTRQPERQATTQARVPATEPAAPPSAAGAAQTAFAPPHGWYVQVCSLTEEASARRLRAELAARLPAVIQPATVHGRSYFRVLVGPYTSRAAAEAAQGSVGRPDTIITRVRN